MGIKVVGKGRRINGKAEEAIREVDEDPSRESRLA